MSDDFRRLGPNMSLARFAEKWCLDDCPPEPVSEEDLQSVERRFEVRLPEDYREAVLGLGLPRTSIALLDAIVDRELDLFDLSDFYSPTEIIDQTLSWRKLGLPESLIAIASDCSGNMFCFDVNQLREDGTGGRPIWFFDHDFETVEPIARSFEAWINAYCEVEPSSQS